MNPQEARLILQCRRARGQDDALPAMAEAWQTLQDFPDLKKELGEDAAFDALIGEKLRAFPVPSALRSSILAGARITPQIPWWRRRLTVFSAAALIAVGVSSLLIKPHLSRSSHEIAQSQSHPGLTEFRDATTQKVNNDGIHFSKASGDFSELQTYLASHSTSHPGKISSTSPPCPPMAVKFSNGRDTRSLSSASKPRMPAPCISSRSTPATCPPTFPPRCSPA